MTGKEDFEAFSGDAEALALARRLAKLDFSSASGIRAPLRARLLAKARGNGARPVFRPVRVALSLALAALLLTVRAAFRDRPHAFPRGEQGLPVLPGRLIAREPARPQDLFEITAGRIIPRESGSAVLWEIDGAAYVLETRKVSLEDLFESRAL